METEIGNVNIATSEMLELCGEIVTIQAITRNGQYYIKEDDGFQWTDGMFAGKVDDDNEIEYKSFFDNQ